MEREKDKRVGNSGMSSGLTSVIRIVADSIVKGAILMGPVFCMGTFTVYSNDGNNHSAIEGKKINGHEYVDLGLSVKWATCNVGALSPSDYGDYYAWGEVLPKSEYRVDNCKICKKRKKSISGDSRYDAARVNWGGSWRLPTKSEWEEVVNKCTWTWMIMNGTKGYKVVGPNGNSIFLPAAGYRYGSSLYYAGSYGYYWSSSPYENYAGYAYFLYFNGGNHYVYWLYRNRGRSVRPVSE